MIELYKFSKSKYFHCSTDILDRNEIDIIASVISEYFSVAYKLYGLMFRGAIVAYCESDEGAVKKLFSSDMTCAHNGDDFIMEFYKSEHINLAMSSANDLIGKQLPAGIYARHDGFDWNPECGFVLKTKCGRIYISACIYPVSTTHWFPVIYVVSSLIEDLFKDERIEVSETASERRWCFCCDQLNATYREEGRQCYKEVLYNPEIARQISQHVPRSLLY